MWKTGRFWGFLFTVLFLLGAGGFFLVRQAGQTGQFASVHLDGALIERIDLSAVAVPYSFEITSERGHNTIHVTPGGIAVSAADCPDQICVRQGEISDGAIPIVCMPHRLVIQIEESVP